jgi:isopenicillin N synthase-like dioxygenase
MTRQIPVIDISPWFDGNELARNAVAHNIDDACKEWGFLIISGHYMDPNLMRAVADVSREFFDLPLEEKVKCDASSRGGRGYYRMQSKAFERTYGKADAPGDLRESFSFRLREGTTPSDVASPWPERPAGMQQIWMDYLSACDRLSAELMHICARALGLPDIWFDDKIDRPSSSMTAQHYPKLLVSPKRGEIRGGAHTDFGTLTLLLTEDRPGGLQVMGTDDEWYDLKPVPGAYIVNLGDMMAQWTNDRWRSTLHRVVNPPLESGEASRRLSIVYFHHPNHDALIKCIPSCTDAQHPPKYAPVVAGEHLRRKLEQVDSASRKGSSARA